MLSRLLLIAGGGLIALGATFAASGADSQIREPECFPAPKGHSLRLLFIGNSFTYYNNMPAMVEAISAANGLKVRTKLIATGGATLHDHLGSEDVSNAIHEGWDYVFFQEQSGFGDAYLINGKFRIKSTDRWMADAELLVAQARSAGARPVLLAHWARADSPEDAVRVEQLYSIAARRTGACLIRNSRVFALAEKSEGRDALYDTDGLHPSPLKSYLIAAALVRELAGRSLTTIPKRIVGEPIDSDEGKRLGGTAELASLRPMQVNLVRNWVENVNTERLDGLVADPAVPKLPRGQGLPPFQSLVGRWTGPLVLYPVPASMQIDLRADPKGLFADVHVSTGKEASNLPVTIMGDELSVWFPQGPNGTKIEFRLRNVGDGLVAVAHFRSEDGGLEGYGTWSGKRTG